VAVGDVDTGVPAEPAADGHRQRHRALVTRLPRLLDPDLGVGAARGADSQLAVLLAVQVEENRAAHEQGVEPGRTLAWAADLLVHRHQQLERSVRQRRVLGERQHRRDPDAVVGAERRPVGGQPITLAHEDDPALGGIVWTVGPTLAHHVEMPLQYENRRRLATCGGRNAHHEVPGSVLARRETAVGRPGAYVLDHLLLVTRRPPDPGQRLEVPPAPGRLEPRKCSSADHQRHRCQDEGPFNHAPHAALLS
jgi:hypothetical protein